MPDKPKQPGKNQEKDKKAAATRVISSQDLRVVERGSEFVLGYGDETISTTEGHEVVHPTRRLLDHMIDEFDLEGQLTLRGHVIEKPRFFCAYAIYGIQKAFVEQQTDELSAGFAGELQRDGMLYRVAGPEAVEQLSRWQSVLDFLGTLGVQLPDLVSFDDNRDLYVDEEQYQWAKEHSAPPPDFVAVVEQQYRQMKPEQRAITMFLHAIHDGVVLFPLVLALGKCTPERYASGVMAAGAIIAGVFTDVKKKEHQNMFRQLREDARTGLEYIHCYQ